MNYIASFYASLYDSRVKANQPASESPLNGNIILSLCLIMLIGSLIVTISLLFPGFGDVFEDLLKDIFGRRLGRTMGKFLVIIGLLIFFPIIRFTVGTDANFQKNLADFRALSESEQDKVSKKGAWFIGLTLGSFVLPLLVWLIMSMF